MTAPLPEPPVWTPVWWDGKWWAVEPMWDEDPCGCDDCRKVVAPQQVNEHPCACCGVIFSPPLTDGYCWGCARAYTAGQRDAIAAVLARVEAIPELWPTTVPGALPRRTVLEAIKGEQT